MSRSGMETADMTSLDSFRCCKTVQVGSKTYAYFSLPTAERNGLKGISRLPFSMKVLLENLLRWEDGRTVTKDDIKAVAAWLKTKSSEHEIAFRPARVLMQDFTGVPAVVDLAARSEEHTSELQSRVDISYAVFCLQTKKTVMPTPPLKCLAWLPRRTTSQQGG